MSIPEELSTDSLQRPPNANRPPPIPLRRTMGKSTDELQRSPSSPVSGAADSSPSYFNQSMASIQQPFLSSPSQKGSSSGSKKLQDFKHTFFATWSRGTSAKKRQPQIQHQTSNGSNLASNLDPSMSMMMPDAGVGGGLVSYYGSGNTVNMRSGTSSQSSINRLNYSGFSNNRDSSSQYSDCERNSFCSSMSDEAISPDAAKQQRAMFGHSDGASPFVYSRDPQLALGSGNRGGMGATTSSISVPPQLTLPCSMMAVCDYNAVKEDQISVKAGDSVQVLSVRKSMYYVFKEATGQTNQDAEGYIPAHVVNPSCAELSHSQDSLKSPLPVSSNPNILNSTLSSLPAQRSSWHSTTPRLFDQSTMSRQSRDREAKNVANCRKSRSAAILSKQLSGSGEENNHSSILNTFRRRHRSTSKNSTVSRRLIGSGSDVSSDGRPCEPGRPEIRKKSRTSVEIEWKPPEYTGNQLITGYTIEISRKNSNMFSPCGTMVSEPFALIEDLTPGVSYQFRVSAHNQSGISLPSEASEFVTISATENNKKGRSLSEGLGKVSWSSKFDDHYIRIEEIGRGRFSTVWKCEHKKLKRAVAAKVINKSMLSKSDLESEAAVLNSLQHPNIIKAIQAYNSSGNPILVLELLPAGRLLDFIITHYSISYTEGVACNFVENVVQALHYLHLNGIAHLDLKPENVMVSMTATSTTAKLIDFGDASLLITNNNNNNIPHCSTASILGSVEFCAPELIESSGKVPATAQTDMWSLGCLIYVLLTGLSPFFDETTEETCRHIIEVDYSFPAEHFQEVSESAIELIKLLLAKDPLLRITSSSCVSHPWFQDCFPVKAPVIDTERLQSFIDRRVYWSTDVRPLKKEIVKQLENS